MKKKRRKFAGKKFEALFAVIIALLITTGFALSPEKNANASTPTDAETYCICQENQFVAYGETSGMYASIRRTDAAVEQDAYYLVADADTGMTTSEKIVDITDDAEYVRLADGSVMIRTMVITESGAHRYVLSPSFLQFAE